jgi:hypothetical protein
MTTSPKSLLSLNNAVQMELHRPREGELTLRRYGWQVAGDEARYDASCYHARHYQQVRGSQRRGTRGQQQGTLFDGESKIEPMSTNKLDTPGAPAPTR